MKDSKNIIIGLLVFIIVILLVFIGLLVSGSVTVSSFNSDENIIDNEDSSDNNNLNDVVSKTYKFGEEVILSNLSRVNDWYGEGDVQDFSKWNVLSDEGDYVVLYSSKIWGKASTISTSNNSDLFSEYGINLGSDGVVRGLDEKDLKLLGCDVDTLVCNNTPSWACYSLTNISFGNYSVVFEKDKLEIVDNQTVLFPVAPVIKILKTSIK